MIDSIGRHDNPNNGIYQSHTWESENVTVHPMRGTYNIREILAANLASLRDAAPNLSAFPAIARAGGPANGTLGRIKKMEAGATIDTLADLAKVFGIQPWQTLLPNLQAQSNGTNHPTLLNVPGWPFPLVKQSRYEALSEEDKGFVQARFLAAIEEREQHKRPNKELKRLK